MWLIKRYARKSIYHRCMVWIEKSVTRDHCSASRGLPRDADQWPSWQILLSTPYTHERYLYYHRCMVWIEKSVTRDHCSASLGKPRDADQWPSWQIFLSTPYTHERYLYSLTVLQFLWLLIMRSLNPWSIKLLNKIPIHLFVVFFCCISLASLKRLTDLVRE